MKKALIFLVTFSLHTKIMKEVSLPILAQEVDTIIIELDNLLDYFVDGQLVEKAPAHSFILKNFGDANLSSLSFENVQSLLTAFEKTYKQSDTFYAEYQMWAAYVPARYWELQLLAGVTDAAQAFSFTYLNNFKPVYTKNSNALSEPYKTQLAGMALEFSVVYASARAVIQARDNNLYA